MMKPESESPQVSQANAALLWRNGLANAQAFHLSAKQLDQLLNAARDEARGQPAAVNGPAKTGWRLWLSKLTRTAPPVQPRAEILPFPVAPAPPPAKEPADVPPEAAELEVNEDLQAQIRAIYSGQ